MKQRGSWLFKKKYLVGLMFLYGSVLSSIVLAHGKEESAFRIEEVLTKASLEVILVSSIIIIACTGMAMMYEKKWKNHKQALFLGIVIPTIIATVVLVGSTVYINAISETKGPVHWHADFEIWVCGEKIDLLDPKGLSNRIGTSVFHEHNDNRIHVEGVVVDKGYVDVDSFFEVIGGELTQRSMSIPTNNGMVSVKNGDLCNGKPGQLQAFAYQVTNPDPNENTGFIYKQKKLLNFASYILAPYAYVPPGDCIIIEFGEEKVSTQHICETYRIAESKGDLHGS